MGGSSREDPSTDQTGRDHQTIALPLETSGQIFCRLRRRSGFALPAPQATERFLTLIDGHSHLDCRATKRFGRRDAAGNIIEAYGFNLAPLAARTPALEAMAEARSKRLREAADLRKRIGHAARIVMLMAQNAGCQSGSNFDWSAAFAEAGTISRRALEPPSSGRPERLIQFLARLEELSAAALVACAAEPGHVAGGPLAPEAEKL